MKPTESIIARDMAAQRRECETRRVLRALRDTIQLRGIKPDTPVDDVYADFTDDSARIIVPLVEAVELLAMLLPQAEMLGHLVPNSDHSIPKRARALLTGIYRQRIPPEFR